MGKGRVISYRFQVSREGGVTRYELRVGREGEGLETQVWREGDRHEVREREKGTGKDKSG